MTDERVRIDWSYSGKPDPLSGTGATPAERALMWGASVLLTALLAYAVHHHAAPAWTWWQWLIFAVVAFDVGGGVVANTLNSCKRLYLSPPNEHDTDTIRQLKNHWLFVGFHLHPIVVGGLFPGGTATNGVLWWGLMVAAVGIVLNTPLYLRRPAAFLLITIATTLALYLVPLAPGFEWLMPFMFLKIVYGHCVREEPYRPA